jgi:hypothetical protein
VVVADLVELASTGVGTTDPTAPNRGVQGGDLGNYPDAVLPKPPLEQELGVGSNMPFSMPYSGPGSQDEQLFEEVRPLGPEDGPSVTQLEMMRRMDGQARALYRLITEPIRSALRNAKVTPAQQQETAKPGAVKGIKTAPTKKEPVADGEAEAQFIEALFTTPASSGGMIIPFKRVMAQMMLGVFDGFSPFELVYRVPKTGPLKGKIALKKVAYRPANTITFLTDVHGQYQGMRQRTFFNGRTVDEKLDSENTIYYAANEEERPFYGVSYFQAAFYHYDKKMKLYYIAHLAAQRAATGLRVGRMPAGASVQDKHSFQAAMADLGMAQYITLPGSSAEGWDVTVVKDGPSFDFLSYINHQNSQMSKSVLAPFFDQNQGAGSDSSPMIVSAPTDPTQGMFTAMIKAIMDELQDVINNEVIPRFIDWNFNSGKYPTWQFGTFTDEQEAAIESTFDKLAAVAQSGLSVTPEFMRALEEHMAQEMGLDVDYAAVAAREKAAADSSAAMSSLQLQAMRQQVNPDQSGDGSDQGGGQQGSQGGDQSLDSQASSAQQGPPEKSTRADRASLSNGSDILALAYQLLEESVSVS